MSVTRGVVVVLGLLLVIHAVAAPVGATTLADSVTISSSEAEERTVVSAGPLAQTTAENTSNTSNTSDRHIGPDLPASESTETVVLSELEARIGSRLINSSDAVEARQFDAAEAELQGNTTELLRQYERVAAGSDSPTDDEIARELNLTVQQQRELIDTARNARANYSEYQLARANGNETRARQIARDLLESAADANETAAELAERYERLGNLTDINTTELNSNLNRAQDRLTELQETVRTESFVTTNLTVNATAAASTSTNLTVNATAAASPTRPLRVHGQLSANTTGLPNGTIELVLGDQAVQTTPENATFNASLRPITVAPGNRTATVRFVPAPTSKYESVRHQIDVRVSAVTPSVTIHSATRSAQFNDTVVVHGHVSANNTSLAAVPVQVTIDETRIGTVRTNSTGEFTVRKQLPASVPNGTRTITVAVSQMNTSVRQTTHEQSLHVDPTPTQLALTITQQNQTVVTVSGRLTTVTGTALSDRPVALSVGDSASVTVRTDEDGRINATLSLPTGVDSSSLPFVSTQLTVTGQYAASGTNLQSTTQTATLDYTPPLSQSLRRTGYAGLAVLVLSGAVVAWRRRAATPDALGSDDSTTTSPDSAVAADVSTDLSPSGLLDHARTAQTDGRTTDAVRLSYVALRHEYVDTFDLNPALTHWELYRALDTELDASAHEFLYELTAAYERATYTERPELLPDSDIETMLTRLEEQID